jgi:hypothetical protein
MTMIKIHINCFYSDVYQEPLMLWHAVVKERKSFERKMEIVVEADQSHAVRIKPIFPNYKVTTQSSFCMSLRHVEQWWYNYTHS